MKHSGDQQLFDEDEDHKDSDMARSAFSEALRSRSWRMNSVHESPHETQATAPSDPVHPKYSHWKLNIPNSCPKLAHRSNAMDQFREKYGQQALELFVEIISQEPDFYTSSLNRIECPSKLDDTSGNAWSRLIAQLQQHYDNVIETDAYKAWRVVRKDYNNTHCLKEWRRALPFLNELSTGQRRRKSRPAQSIEADHVNNCNPAIATPESSEQEENLSYLSDIPDEQPESEENEEPSDDSAVALPDKYKNNLYAIYGDHAVFKMISEIGKYPDFYAVNAKIYKTSSDLPESVIPMWRSIMIAMEADYPGVPENLVFTAWKTLRKTYHTKKCPKKYANTIPYLDEYFDRDNGLFSLLGQSATDLLVEEAGKHREFHSVNPAHLENLPEGALRGWRQIVEVMSARFNGVTEEMIFKAWIGIRRFYNAPSRRRRYAGKIDYLNEINLTDTDQAQSQDEGLLEESSGPVGTRQRKRHLDPVEQECTTPESRQSSEVPKKKRNHKSATQFFEDEYGSEAIALLFDEIGKEQVFYASGLSKVSETSDLKHDLRRAWKRIFTAVSAKFPSVNEAIAFKAWSSARKNYFNSAGCGHPWFGKIPYLNNWDVRNNCPKVVRRERSPSLAMSETVDVETIDETFHAPLEPPPVNLPQPEPSPEPADPHNTTVPAQETTVYEVHSPSEESPANLTALSEAPTPKVRARGLPVQVVRYVAGDHFVRQQRTTNENVLDGGFKTMMRDLFTRIGRLSADPFENQRYLKKELMEVITTIWDATPDPPASRFSLTLGAFPRCKIVPIINGHFE